MSGSRSGFVAWPVSSPRVERELWDSDSSSVLKALGLEEGGQQKDACVTCASFFTISRVPLVLYTRRVKGKNAKMMWLAHCVHGLQRKKGERVMRVWVHLFY